LRRTLLVLDEAGHPVRWVLAVRREQPEEEVEADSDPLAMADQVQRDLVGSPVGYQAPQDLAVDVIAHRGLTVCGGVVDAVRHGQGDDRLLDRAGEWTHEV